ncbi:hypothetical protein J2T49_002653 [Pseudomonas nitroreducens]|nr:hypothetical protein [Pseudomonas nitroreducens]MCP1686705.1 hypothetical protein [Pseudomonas nitroreducens]
MLARSVREVRFLSVIGAVRYSSVGPDDSRSRS